jgi:thioredoxin-like negative regulator of GroEL
MEEWKTLRNQCEASGIKLDDEDRKSTEEAISLAKDAHKAGRVDEALESLGLADGFMERLRRRV